MNEKKLIKLRCKAWGITEDEYYCNQCSDFSLEDMARAYRRGKNKGRADLEKENTELKEQIKTLATMNNNMWVELEKKRAESQGITNKLHQLIKAKERIRDLLEIIKRPYQFTAPRKIQIVNEAEQLIKEE